MCDQLMASRSTLRQQRHARHELITHSFLQVNRHSVEQLLCDYLRPMLIWGVLPPPRATGCCPVGPPPTFPLPLPPRKFAWSGSHAGQPRPPNKPLPLQERLQCAHQHSRSQLCL